MYQKFFKRMIDLLVSCIGLFILSPIFLILIICIKLESRGSIFFKQKRIGRDKQVFIIYKFRTMKIDTPKEMPTHLLTNPEQHITRVGKLLRRTSLDELPQLINIIKGDMAVIGPRPALWNQDDLIESRDQCNVNTVRPVLTGWAQINGRDELEVCEKVKLDTYYVTHIRFWLDVKCFIGTIVAVFHSSGVIEGGTGVLDKNVEEEKL